MDDGHKAVCIPCTEGGVVLKPMLIRDAEKHANSRGHRRMCDEQTTNRAFTQPPVQSQPSSSKVLSKAGFNSHDGSAYVLPQVDEEDFASHELSDNENGLPSKTPIQHQNQLPLPTADSFLLYADENALEAKDSDDEDSEDEVDESEKWPISLLYERLKGTEERRVEIHPPKIPSHEYLQHRIESGEDIFPSLFSNAFAEELPEEGVEKSSDKEASDDESAHAGDCKPSFANLCRKETHSI